MDKNNTCSGCGCQGFHSSDCPYLSKTAWAIQNDPAYKIIETELQTLRTRLAEAEQESGICMQEDIKYDPSSPRRT